MIGISVKIMSKFTAALILIASLTYAYQGNFKISHAAVNPSGLTGKYGCMLSRNTSGFVNYYNTYGPGDSVGTTVTAILNYDSNTTQALVSQISNYGSPTSPQSNDVISTGTFVESTINGYSDAYRIVLSLTDSNNRSGTMTMVAVPVNSGNTILVTQTSDTDKNAPWTGVCQKK